jgi:large subunit ribosomal protein L21
LARLELTDFPKLTRFFGRFMAKLVDLYLPYKYFLRGLTMYAVIKTGGKQYKVAAGEKLKIEQIPADIGSDITLDQVLAVGEGASLKVGDPLVNGAAVMATVVSQGRHDKVKIFKMRRRKHYQKHQGHRQNFTEILIKSIKA